MNILKTFASIMVFSCIFGCSGKPPVKVELSSNEMVSTVKIIKITALEEVTVNGVRFNRGAACQTYSYRNLPAKLSFGNELTIAPGCRDNIIEAEVSTDKGNYTFNF